MVPAQNRDFLRCPRLFGPKNGTSRQSLKFVPGPFGILEMAPVSDFQGLISNYPATFTAVTLIVNH